MGKLIRNRQIVPDLIITSTAKRAFATAKSVAAASGYQNDIKYTRQLYHAWVDTFIEVVSGVPGDPERVMIVGHNPGMEELVEVLTGERERMPTAALAQIELPILHWQELDEETDGKLVYLWRPKEIYWEDE
jgi:phosphohistidine phosphatase